jgi:murein DD-endopeptidase MepM/ murein hydrolase activator NlpD
MRRNHRIMGIVILLSVAAMVWIGESASAANPAPFFQEGPVLQLPFNTPPGPSTWYVIQWYGNTQTAYYYRSQWYRGGQGLHFGIDFSTRCGTEIVAVGDGIVIGFDELKYGSGPHNLLILHGDDTVSLYGHLLEPPLVALYDEVKQGQVIGLSGDPDLTCTSRPHLHLEIRDRGSYHAYNPIRFIDADWDSLALFGPVGFERDLDNPRQWMTPLDQPNTAFGEPLLNNFANPWPPIWGD